MQEEEENIQKSSQKSNQESKPIITGKTAQELDNVFDEREKGAEEKVEAALFISGKFLNLQALIMLTDINPIMLKEKEMCLSCL